MFQSSRAEPDWKSASASFASRSSLPAQASCSICLSQAAASNSANQRRNSASSDGGSASMAFSCPARSPPTASAPTSARAPSSAAPSSSSSAQGGEDVAVLFQRAARLAASDQRVRIALEHKAHRPGDRTHIDARRDRDSRCARVVQHLRRDQATVLAAVQEELNRAAARVMHRVTVDASSTVASGLAFCLVSTAA